MQSIYSIWILGFVLIGLTACSHTLSSDALSSTPADISPQRNAVKATALLHLGSRYQFGGADVDGFDCSGLVYYVHQKIGVRLPRTAAQQKNAARQIKPQQLKPGDLLFFKIGSRRINHVGLYIGHGEMIHAPRAGAHVRIESIQKNYWQKHFASAGTYLE